MSHVGEEASPLLGVAGEGVEPGSVDIHHGSLSDMAKFGAPGVRGPARRFWHHWGAEAFTRAKSINQVLEEHNDLASEAKKTLKRSLTVFDLMGYGIGCTVGAGIYSLVGAGAKVAGPGILISFLVGAFSCLLTGLSYSEFAARVPVAGSAYTYAYTSFGELVAWVIGYAISAAAVARSWANYVLFLVDHIGLSAPEWLAIIPLGGEDSASPLAAVLVLACTGVVLLGVSKGSMFNIAVTCLNLAVLTFVAIAGAFSVKPHNWTVVNDSFVPYGPASIFVGAGTVFFSYLGFDMVTSLAEETKKPQRDMPLGIIGSLIVSGGIYVAVTLVLCGMVPFTEITNTPEHMAAPLAYAFKFVGLGWATSIISIGSVAGLTTACFTCLLGQPRIFYRMAVDGMLPPMFKSLNAQQVPVAATWLTGIVTALIAFFISLEILAEAISIGTLCAFSLVDAGVIAMRFKSEAHPRRVYLLLAAYVLTTFVSSVAFTQGWSWIITAAFGGVSLVLVVVMWLQPVTELPPTFKCPLVPFVPAAAIAINNFMMAGLSFQSWMRLLIWTVLGMLIYLTYSVSHSSLITNGPAVTTDSRALLPKPPA